MKIKHTLALLATALVAGHAAAAQCDVEIVANDAMQFDKTTLAVPASCKQFTVKLKHGGKLPKAAMGHNWVLAKTADMAGVLADGAAAGPDKNYVKPADARVISATKVIGGGESATATFDASKLKAGEAYSWFCSFPGHSSMMKGTLSVTR